MYKRVQVRFVSVDVLAIVLRRPQTVADDLLRRHGRVIRAGRVRRRFHRIRSGQPDFVGPVRHHGVRVQ